MFCDDADAGAIEGVTAAEEIQREQRGGSDVGDPCGRCRGSQRRNLARIVVAIFLVVTVVSRMGVAEMSQDPRFAKEGREDERPGDGKEQEELLVQCDLSVFRVRGTTGFIQAHSSFSAPRRQDVSIVRPVSQPSVGISVSKNQSPGDPRKNQNLLLPMLTGTDGETSLATSSGSVRPRRGPRSRL